MKRTLLPLNALRVFEAAARHLSFTRAADELAVTPAAVGQHIRALEDLLGVVLFKRTARALQLTPEASRALPALREGFLRFEDAVKSMQAAQNSNVLTISVAASFASKWLVPRLDHFMAGKPDMQVRVLAADKLTDFTQENIDLSIHYGSGHYPEVVSEKLIDETLVAVAAPTLAKAFKKPMDLASAALIHDDSLLDEPDAKSWAIWLQNARVDVPHVVSGLHFNMSALVIDAAIAGKGVALVKAHLAAADILAGRLVPLFNTADTRMACLSYWMVAPEPQWRQKKVKAFVGWLKEQAVVTPHE
jgi:LysR family transcriptional regulator, glycine cleavage system transcriptional activator